METTYTKTLVNFRVEINSLKAFDSACTLSSQTRTQILNQLIRDYTAKAAIAMPKQIAEEQRSLKTLRAAVERAYGRRPATSSKSRRIGVQTAFYEGFRRVYRR